MKQGKALTPNVGIEKWYYKEIHKACLEMFKQVRKELMPVVKDYAEDSAFDITVILNKLQRQYYDYFKKYGETVVKKFIARQVKFARISVKAAVEPILKKDVKLSLPGSIITEKNKDIVKMAVYNNVNLIKSISTQYFKEIIGEVTRSMEFGGSLAQLSKMLTHYEGVTERRAKLITHDQTRKVYSNIALQEMKDAGFNRVMWKHSNAGEKPRDYHLRKWDGKSHNPPNGLNGYIFDLDNPPIIQFAKGKQPEVWGYPSQLVNCYSKDTEVLTSAGFKLIKDVQVGENVATINPDNGLWEWSVCTNTVKKKVNEIANFHSRLFDLKVSTNHTFFYYKKKYNGKKFIKDSQYPVFTTGIETLSKKNTYFKATADWAGFSPETVCGIPTEIFCKFLGYYLSDGSVDKRSKTCIKIAQCNNDWMYNELAPYIHVCKGKQALYIYNKDLYSIVAPLGLCYDKHIPDFVLGFNKKHLRVFLDAFAKCDVTPANTKIAFDYKPYFVYNRYYTTSPRLMAQLVECIYKVGMSVSVYKNESGGRSIKFRNGTYKINYDCFVISEMKTLWRDLVCTKTDMEPYNDFVYDIEVEKNHTLLIKTGKSIHWNSNCKCFLVPVE